MLATAGWGGTTTVDGRRLGLASIEGIASAGIGCVIGFWGVRVLPVQAFQALSAMESGIAGTQLLLSLSLTLIMLVAGALGVVLAGGLRIPGWALATGGLAIAAACFDRDIVV